MLQPGHETRQVDRPGLLVDFPTQEATLLEARCRVGFPSCVVLGCEAPGSSVAGIGLTALEV